MGIEPFLVSSSVIAIVAQRLVRVLCPRCKEAYQPDAESLIDAWIARSAVNGRPIYRRKGCNACMNTGYRGRTGIFEIMNMDEGVKKLILKTSDSNQINEEAVRNGMSTLVQDGARKVLEGVTTLEEVLRVTRVLNRNSNVVIEDEEI
jgi:general secretion pathway protein E